MWVNEGSGACGYARMDSLSEEGYLPVSNEAWYTATQICQHRFQRV